MRVPVRRGRDSAAARLCVTGDESPFCRLTDRVLKGGWVVCAEQGQLGRGPHRLRSERVSRDWSRHAGPGGGDR